MALTQVQGQMLSGSNNTTTTIQSNGTTAITIDSSGNTTFAGSVLGTSETFQVGVNSAGKDTRFGVLSGGNGRVEFYSAGSERMRIDSSGNVLIGKTTNAATVVGTAINNGTSINTARAETTNAASTFEVYSTGAGNYRFYLGMGGTIYATSTTITAISDQRLKENIEDIDVGLNAVMALKPRKFDWKEGKGKDKKGDRGWVAQEFEQVFPEMIDSWKDPAPEGEEPYKAVNADLIPVLVKAIQELKAIVDTQATKIAELEAKLSTK